VRGRPNNVLMLQTVTTDVLGMPSPRLIRRWLKQVAPASALPSRTDIRPPAVGEQAEPMWKSMWQWLRRVDVPVDRRLRTLEQARCDFGAALADLPADDACDLRRRGQSARSLRELWHLRAELYSVVARHRSQSEADRRLGLVNRHFPTSTTPTTTAATRPGQRPRT
jgi:hypothetical protein